MRAEPEGVRGFGIILNHHLRSQQISWTQAVEGKKPGSVVCVAKRHRNSAEQAEEALLWLDRANAYEAGHRRLGGPEAQSWKADACARILSHENSVILAEEHKRIEDERRRARANQQSR